MSPAVSRLVWKEYRAQRKLWVALLPGTVLLQLIYFAFEPQSRIELFFYPALLAMALGVCHAAACMAMLFAGEREEDTDRLLQALPLHPRDLWLAKLGYSAVAIGLFFIIVCLWTLVVFPDSFAPVRSYEVSQSLLSLRGPGLFYVTWAVCALTLLSSFFFRSVVQSLAMGGALLLAVTLLSTLINDAIRGSGIAGPIGLSLAALLASIGSAWALPRWLRSEPLLEQFRFTRTSARSENDQPSRSLRVLRWATRRSTPVLRTASVLLWKDLRTMALPAVVMFVLPMLGVVLLWSVGEAGQTNGWILECVAVIALPAFALLVGTGTFAYEQRTRTMGFLAERGASPQLVWVCRQVAGLVIVIVGVALTWLPVFEFIGDGRSVHEFITRRDPFIGPPNYNGSITLTICLWLYVALFGMGQMFSVWIRSAILRWIAAILSGFVLVGITGAVIVERDISVWVSLIPLAIISLLASFFTMNAWILQKHSRLLLLGKTAWLSAAVLVPLGLSLGYLVVSIPPFPDPIDWRKHAAVMQNFDPIVTEKYRQLLRFADAGLPSDVVNEELVRRADRSRDTEKTASELPQILHELVLAMQKSSTQRLEPSLVGSRYFNFSLHQLERVFELNWTKQLKDSPQAWEFLQDTLTLQAWLQVQSWDSFMSFQAWRSDTLAAVREWVQQPGRTEEELRKAVATLERHQLNYDGTLMNQYTLAKQMLRGEGLGHEFADEFASGTVERLQFPGSWFPQIEAWRGELVMNLILGPQLDPLSNLSGNLSRQANWSELNEWQINRLILSTPALHHLFWMQEVHRRQYSSTEMKIRATRLVTELELWKHEHGTYPESLLQLLNPRMPQLPVDPRTHREFQYASRGLERPLIVTTHRDAVEIIAAGTPLLWTEGGIPNPERENPLLLETIHGKTYLMRSSVKAEPSSHSRLPERVRDAEAGRVNDNDRPEPILNPTAVQFRAF